MLVFLPDGSSEYVMNQKDAVDIVRRMCGDDLAGILERADWERHYENYFACLEEMESLEVESKALTSQCDALIADVKEGVLSIQKKMGKQTAESEQLSDSLNKLEDGMKSGLKRLLGKADAIIEDLYAVDLPSRENIYR